MALFTENVMFDLIVLALTIIVTVRTFFKWKFSFWERKGVEAVSPTIPFGNGKDVFFQKEHIATVFTNLYREFRRRNLKFGGAYILTKPFFLPVDPNLIKHIMAKDFEHFTNHANYVNEKVDPLSGNLFSLKDQKWRNLRIKLTPTFTSGKMKMMFQTLVDCSTGLTKLVDKLTDAKEPLDVKEVISRFTTDVIGSCAFGINCNCLENPESEFRMHGKKIFQPTTFRTFVTFLRQVAPRLLQWLNISIGRKDVRNFFINLVKETVEYREKNNVTRNDFMQLLIQIRNNNKIDDSQDDGSHVSKDQPNEFTIEEMAAQAFVFFVAGFETSSTTTTFCFYELVANPEIQEKLRNEIHDVLKRHNGQITYDAIMEMTYMDSCIYETLRKYPPGTLLSRECTKTYTIPDTDITIEKNQTVFIPVYALHHDPEYYPDPEIFDPERFNAENKANRLPYTWLPFGEGPRICIGLRFGILQTKVALVVLLLQYKFTLNKKTVTPLKMDPRALVLSTKDGIWLNLQKM